MPWRERGPGPEKKVGAKGGRHDLGFGGARQRENGAGVEEIVERVRRRASGDFFYEARRCGMRLAVGLAAGQS